MRRLVLITALALAGCGGESSRESAAATGEINLKNASVAEVAEQTRAAQGQMRFTPGQWRTTVQVVEAEVPGLPPAMAEEMKKRMLAKQTIESCMTREQAERPNEDLFGQQAGCRFDRFTMKDGRIDAAMTCANPDQAQQGTASIVMTGTFDAENFAMESRIEARGAGAPGIKMRSRVTGERLGACT